MLRLIDHSPSPPDPDRLYITVVFPKPPPDRPYTFLNMVASVDGKTVFKKTAKGLGSKTDQTLMHRLEANADCILIGSSTLRADSSVINYPANVRRAVVTTTGDVPLDSPFFAPGLGHVLAPRSLPEKQANRIRASAALHLVGEHKVDFRAALQLLRKEFGIEKLLCEGGSTLNAALFAADLVDEMFLTVAPNIRGGTDLPTVVGGEKLPADTLPKLTLVSLYCAGDELFLRYAVQRDG